MHVKSRKVRKIFIIVLCVLLSIPLVVFPVTTVVMYEVIFQRRYETVGWMTYDVADFEGLRMERSDFDSDGVTLAGYAYTREGIEGKGIVILAHGLGGGGQNRYMPFADYFTAHGYYVFTYDARGNDNSGGKVGGLPQGLVDLDNAITYVESLEAYAGLPIALLGHSWGGYSVGNVLNLHPEVKAAVILAGFNESENLLEYEGVRMVGDTGNILTPYLQLYERIKFGSVYTDVTAVEGMEKTGASVMVVHSRNDSAVPIQYGYDIFYAAFADSERFNFVEYEDRGHDYLYCSPEAMEAIDAYNEAYTHYIEDNGREYNAENKAAFAQANLNKATCFALDPDLMEQMTDMMNARCVG